MSVYLMKQAMSWGLDAYVKGQGIMVAVPVRVGTTVQDEWHFVDTFSNLERVLCQISV